MQPDDKIFIAGIGGVFMAGVAQLARAAGCRVRGCDAGIYPPMSDVLDALDIDIADGYAPEHLGRDPGTVVIGNALSRGNPLVEAALERGLELRSGPEWLRENVLRGREVIAVAGTHGKTTAASMTAWILECAGHAPGFLIGGKPGNFDATARAGNGKHFVIEADEYDTAFFDKRAKFVHYRPRIAVLNNLEFDHADIYDDLGQIARQFHHLLRTVPGNGCVVVNADDANLAGVIEKGCWSRVVKFSAGDGDDISPRHPRVLLSGGGDGDGGDGDGDGDDIYPRHPRVHPRHPRVLSPRHPRVLLSGGDKIEWRAVPLVDDCSRFDILRHGQPVAQVEWRCIGRHNMSNALASVAAAEAAGVAVESAAKALREFLPAARRLQCVFESAAVILYDDFAHHPTAIAETLTALRARHPQHRIIAIVELRSNTMRSGVHGDKLTEALLAADHAIISGGDGAGIHPRHPRVLLSGGGKILRIETVDQIIPAVQQQLGKLDAPAVLATMSNGDFGGLPARLAESLGAGANA